MRTHANWIALCLVPFVCPAASAKPEIMRKSETRNLDVTVGASKGTKAALANASTDDHGRLGVVVRSLSQDEKKQADVAGGVVVQDATGPAAEAGLQSGDLILALNGTPVKNPTQLKELLAKTGKHVALLVQRNDGRLYIPVDLG